MTKAFKNHVLSIFTFTFFLSQIVNVNANYLRNISQQENSTISVIEKENNKAINMATLYASDFIYGVGNETTSEGKIEKVVEPVRIGNFGFGMAIGYGTQVLGMLLGWIIAKIAILIKSSI
ncbi:hypothetical protein [Bartonella doshiae]|uniref:Uncharacterized protein n=2 Tax=Bartonella doshiae TaxID=33044 RepID=A0A380ZC76_BARDO|nr:hypothetical protein [Bartonella doshiae]EJF81991.1 hypothetical protein MCS_00416 [Bartonella doshiae NCTC 12862 = ATCC 700133]MBB6158986.1 hypothetical protein [Bartonella doshiae]SUV44583.1 Uncharacterised protein [Bartonella doshiae]